MVHSKYYFKLVLIGLSALAVAVAGCSGDNQGQRGQWGGRGGARGMMGGMGGRQQAVPVEVTTPYRTELASYVFGNANVEALREVEVVARVQGLLQKLNVEEGDEVRAGQVLAELDKRELTIAVQEAEARLENTREIYERSRKMIEQQLTSQEAVDQAEFNFKTATSQYDRAKLNLEYASIEAPFAGIITQRLIDRGDLVRVNTVLFHLADTEKLLIRMFVPEKEMGRIDVGDKALIKTEMFPGETFSGEVEMISPVVDPTTGTVKVTVHVTEGHHRLKPGMFCTLYILIDTHENALVITRKALIPETESPEVFLIDNSDTTTVVHRRRIQLGITQGDTLEVVGGLKPDDRIVVVGHESLNENTPVRIVAAGEDSSVIAAPPMDTMDRDARRAEWRKKRGAESGSTKPDSASATDSTRRREMRERWQRSNRTPGTQSQ